MRFLRKIPAEKVFFWIVVVLNTYPVLSQKFSLSLDGPAHLYNATLLRTLLLGDPFHISAFYILNPVPVPNSAGHWILSLIGSLFSGQLTEKIFLLLYLVFLPLSFRYLILSFNKNGKILSYLIFPFCYNFLFVAGFYNFLISFIFLFYCIGYYRRCNGSFSSYLVLALLLMATYFSNLMTFMLAVALLAAITFIDCSVNAVGFISLSRSLLKKLLKLFVATIPAIGLMIMFLMKVKVDGGEDAAVGTGLFDQLLRVRALIMYSDIEGNFTKYYFFLYILLLFLSISMRVYNRVKDRSTGSLLQPADAFLLALACCIYLFFTTPDAASVGMMTIRLLLVSFILLITWLAMQRLPFAVLIISCAMNLFLSFKLVHLRRQWTAVLDPFVFDIYHAGTYIPEGSVVLPVKISDENWLFHHASGYAGSNKPIILLDNYEAGLPWFPVTRNEKMPKTVVGDIDDLNIQWNNNPSAKETRPVDYILLYGNPEARIQERWKQLNVQLDRYYTLIHTGKTGHVALYKYVLSSREVVVNSKN